MTDTVHLGLPLILGNQNSKHITHNEAINSLDNLVMISVADKDLSAPPSSPAIGDRYIVAANPTGAWAGKSGQVTVHEGSASWRFYVPKEGWTAWVADEGRPYHHTHGSWTADHAGTVELRGLAEISVIDKDRSSPPTSPSEGDRYIVGANPTGVWANKAGQTAVYKSGTWQFKAEPDGRRVWVSDEKRLYVRYSNTWNLYPAPATAPAPSRREYHAVLEFGVNSPYPSPRAGDTYIVGDNPTGAFTNQAGKLASFSTSWSFEQPSDGWLVWDRKNFQFQIYWGAWAPYLPRFQDVFPLAHASVKDKDLNAPPSGAIADSDKYIVAAGATGSSNPWAGQSGKIAYRFGSPVAWAFYAPKNGDMLWVDDEDQYYFRNDNKWIVFHKAAAPLISHGHGTAEFLSNAPPSSQTLVRDAYYIVGPNPTGAWAGQANKVAVATLTTWQFLTPNPGWRMYIKGGGVPYRGKTVIWTGSAWQLDHENIESSVIAVRQRGLAAGITLDATGTGGFADLGYMNWSIQGTQKASMGFIGDGDEFDFRVANDPPSGQAVTEREVFTVQRSDGVANFRQGLQIKGGEFRSYMAAMFLQHMLWPPTKAEYKSNRRYRWEGAYTIANAGRGAFFTRTGWFDMRMPNVGTIVSGFGGAPSTAVNADGVLIPNNNALYYRLPIGTSSGATVAGNFRLVAHTQDFQVPEDERWILLASSSGQNDSLQLGSGHILYRGERPKKLRSTDVHHDRYPVFQVSNPTPVAGNINGGQLLRFTAIEHSLSGNGYNASTGQFTAPHKGIYKFEVNIGQSVSQNSDVGTNFGVQLYTAAAGSTSFGLLQASDNMIETKVRTARGPDQFHGSCIAPLEEGAKVQPWIQYNSGSGQGQFRLGTGDWSYWSGQMINDSLH